MKRYTRPITITSLAIIVLIIVVTVLVLKIDSEGVALLPQDEPAGIVQRYIQAIHKGDSNEALSYLSTSSRSKSEDRAFVYDSQNALSSNWKVSVESSHTKGSEVIVTLRVDIFRPRGWFSNPIGTHFEVFLLIQEDSGWYIESPAWLWWLHSNLRIPSTVP
ncbi:hypothetical protein ACFLWX_04485 [Chloroflexota bacterium]